MGGYAVYVNFCVSAETPTNRFECIQNDEVSIFIWVGYILLNRRTNQNTAMNDFANIHVMYMSLVNS